MERSLCDSGLVPLTFRKRYLFPVTSLLQLLLLQIEPVLQEITGEELNRGANKAPDA